MRKRSAYIYEQDLSWIVVIETYLLESKNGIYEHLIKILTPASVPADVDRVICVIGNGGLFSPVDSRMEIFYDGTELDEKFSGSKVPFIPGGRITELSGVVFTKKVYQRRTTKLYWLRQR